MTTQVRPPRRCAMLGTVETRSLSPVFVGRTGELTSLTDALSRATAGEPQALLIGGEAGVGKTRLVEEFLREACREGAFVALGGCVEIGADGLPFAPFSTALRSLRRRLPEGELDAVFAGQEGELARILPELGQFDGAALGEHGTARLFELTARLLERIAADRTVVLVVEDLHWADASTRNLLAYLLRTLRRGRLVVVATYRSDDIHRRHPLRPLLAELERMRAVRRIELARFSRSEVRRQLTGILATVPDPGLVDDVFTRSDGNAFFVEELACSLEGGSCDGLSDSLRDLLLVRVEALPEDAQKVVRLVAEGGSTVEHELLAAVAGLCEDDLIAALRAAVGASILTPTPEGDGYRFRHSLVREAVSDDLLPGERSRLNRRYAQALEADPALVRADERTTRIAGYWYHAHDAAKALPAVLQASVEARKRFAHFEQLRLLERAMELWDNAPEDVRATLRPAEYAEAYPSDSSAGCPEGATAPLRYLDLMAEATVAARYGGDRERALALAKKATRALAEENDPLRSAWFWVKRARLMQDLTRGDGREELATAQDLVRGLPPSAVHADILTAVATWGALHEPGPDSLADADRAVEFARLVGEEYIELQARLTRGWLTVDAGGVEEGIAEMYETRERAETLGHIGVMGRASINLPSTLESIGRSEEAVTAARHGIEVCHAHGLPNMEAWVQINLARSLFSLGHWRECEQAIEAAERASQTDKSRGLVASYRSELALERGEPDEADRQLALAMHYFGHHDRRPQHLVPLARHGMVIAATQGRLLDARAELARAVECGFPPGTQRYALPLLRTAAAIEADALGQPAAAYDRPAVLAMIREAARKLPTFVPVWAAHGLFLEAELARAERRDTPDHWERTAAAFAPLSRPYETAQICYRWAEALLAASGDRATAAGLLRRGHAAAVELGARLLAEDVALLATRARVDLADPGEPGTDGGGHTPESLGLTPREQDVLRLVAEGRSNRQIAQALFISPKTASVHVSNILAKLGVSGRGEAAALAHRLRLYDSAEPSASEAALASGSV
ncbi:AAA family ATPase [Streptomyces sp. NPDC050504]|uniref:helix-turn-helix transcriptional regulator n=1 Tax=Streptomyces sp. NPDC050504 TaxID=3365618 RepID=UPI0037B5F28A